MAGDGRHGPAYSREVETSTSPCVGAVMTAPVVVVRDHDSIWHAIDRFTTTGLHHLVVLDSDDHLVGILDDRQALALWPFDAAGMHRHTVGELMRTRGADMAGTVASVQPDVSARVAGRLMLEQRVDALAVVDDFGRVVGILTGSDLIHHLVKALEQSDSSK
jgi:acetoin utilization protein AcuB